MAFKKGQSGNPAGKPKGAMTHINRDIREMILTALSNAGGAEYLLKISESNPTAFCALVGKILPLTLEGNIQKPVRIIFGDDNAE